MASASAKDDATQTLVDELREVQKWGSTHDLRETARKAADALEAAQRPPVNPELREELATTKVPIIYPGGTRMVDLGYPVADALLARFSIPSQPVYDEEKIAAHIHARAEFDADECDHGTYRGGPLDGQPYAMCERKAAALVAALRSGELT